MKKGLLCVALLGALTLAGCSSSSSDKSSSGEVKEITLWTASSQYFLGDEKVDKDGNTYRDESTAVYLQAAEAFEEETGIKVTFKTVEAGNENVDSLVKNKDASVDIYAAAPVMTDDQIIKYMEPAFDSVEEYNKVYRDGEAYKQSDGKIYIQVPSVAYDGLVVYNEEVIKAAGYDEVPTDMDEFMKMCEAIKADGVTPISEHRIENWPLATFDTFASYMANESGALGEMLKSETPFASDEPMGQAGTVLAELASNGYFESSTYADFGVAMDSVAYGDAGMMLLGNWVAPQIISRIPEGEEATIKVAPFSALDGDDELNVVTVPNVYIYIPKGSDAKDEAQEFIDYLVNNEEVQTAWAATPNLADSSKFENTIPDYVTDLASKIDSGDIVSLPSYVYSPNILSAQEILKDMGVYADQKYWGNIFDAASTDGLKAGEKAMDDLNELWADAKKSSGAKYEESK
ncbi:MAG: ABC transporter substrate-binding protein [Lactovum sp.]